MSSAGSTSTVLPGLGSRLRTRVAAYCARLAGDEMLRKSLLSLVDQAVVSGTNFAITVILGRLCGKPEVGLYYLALQAVMFARGIQEQLICSPFLVYAGRQGNQLKRYAGSSLIHELGLLSIVAIVFCLIGILSDGTELSELMWLLALAAPPMLLREYIRQVAFAELRVTEALLLDCSVAGLQLFALVAAAAFGVLSTPLAYSLLAIGCGIATIGWLMQRRGTFAVDSTAVVSDWLHNWRFARWALASQLLGQTMPLLLPWIVAGTHGQAATGTLGVGTTLIGFANMFVLGLSNFICPRAAQAFARSGASELRKVLATAAAMYLAVLVPFAFAMLLAGDQLMSLIYGSEFADAGSIMAILAFGAVANSLGITAGNGLWAMDRPSANFRADVAAMITWLVATALLVPAYGAWGAAVASSLGTCVGAAARGAILLLATKSCEETQP